MKLEYGISKDIEIVAPNPVKKGMKTFEIERVKNEGKGL